MALSLYLNPVPTRGLSVLMKTISQHRWKTCLLYWNMFYVLQMVCVGQKKYVSMPGTH